MLSNTIAHENQALKGINRSRFSLHFNFFHRRRWLLVQLVSAPTITSTDENTTYTFNAQPIENHRGLSNPLEEYSFNRMQRACI
ncbi:MAG: hypothetical protein ABIQ44_00875 [Chloroflexia bacterium]